MNTPRQPLTKDEADIHLRILENQSLEFLTALRAEMLAAEQGQYALTIPRARHMIRCIGIADMRAQELEAAVPMEWLSPLWFEIRAQFQTCMDVLQRLIGEAEEASK